MLLSNWCFGLKDWKESGWKWRKVPWIFGLPRFARFSSLVFILDQSIFLRGNWITSLRSVFLKCLKSNKEKSSVCNAFFFLWNTPHWSKLHFGVLHKKSPSVPEGLFLVPTTGFEPAHLLAPPPQDGVSTNFTTWAADYSIENRGAKINILWKCLWGNVRKV